MNEQTIFTDALAKRNPAERQDFLDQACGKDGALRAQVEELLAAGEGAGSFLEHPPAGLDATIDASLSGKDTVDNELRGALPPLEPCDKPDRIGKLGLYEIIEVVGQGGMGTVLRAFDTKLGRIVAVKVMAAELAANPTAVKRFLREAQSAAAVVHDHVVTIHAIDDQSRLPYLVMEFIEGQTLQQKIDREGALELKQILRIGSQMAAGLAAAHKTGLIHRDVKPANILLENGVERVKITDFGLARAADDVEMTKTGMIAGTPQYMSPEQATGDAIDSRSDLFSLGSVLYTMCAGRPAFRAETTMGTLRRVTDDTPRPIREVNAEIPDWLEAIVMKLLAKNPDDRFQSAKEVAELLEQHLAHLQQPMKVPQPPKVELLVKTVPPLARRAKRWRPWVAISAAMLLTVWATLWFGPAAWLYVTNACQLTFSIHPDFDEFLVVPGNSASTQWKVKPGSTLTLPPGNYRVEAVGRRGEVISRWDVHGASMFMGYGTQAEGAQFHAKIGRGERLMLSIAAVEKSETKLQMASPDSDGWITLFNGKDLAGWKAIPPQHWRVENGVLHGSGPDGFLVTQANDFEDFHLVAEYRINEKGDSGIHFRMPAPESNRAGRWGYIVTGLEAQVSVRKAANYRSGALTVVDPNLRELAASSVPPHAANEWARLEVIALKDHIQILVNGKLTTDYIDPDRKFQRGHIALCSWEGNDIKTNVEFRMVEIKKLPPSSPAPPTDPFVILTRDGNSQQTFTSLAKAVAAAHSGDTIEIRGDGPFVTAPISLAEKVLVIRAAPGADPVIELNLDTARSDPGGEDYLLRTQAPLTLEGLEFRRLNDKPWEHGTSLPLIVLTDSTLRVANCRFVLGRTRDSILSFGPLVDVRNCEFYGGDQCYHVDWACPAGGRLFLHNNLIAGGEVGLAFHYREPDLKDVSLGLSNNTIKAAMPLAFFFDRIPEPQAGLQDRPAKPMRLEAAMNVFDGQHAILSFAQDSWAIPIGKRLRPPEAVVMLPRLLDWEGKQNLYQVTCDFLNLSFGAPGQVQAVPSFKNLSDWNRLWGRADAESLLAGIGYQGVVPATTILAPNDLSTTQFRLADSSPGKGAGAGGKDLGANLDLVGPGAGYERWKQTPEYREWLEETGQVTTAAAKVEPFVILAKDAKAEHQFASLAAAVAAAQSGDTIEVRGNGPFESPAIQIRGIALSLRAGKGFRPVIRMNEDEVVQGHALLTTNSPLVLEGLELIRATSKPTPILDPLASLVVSRGAPFFAANCRFENKPRQCCVCALGSPICFLQNCELVLPSGVWNNAVSWFCPSGGIMTMDNCLQPSGMVGPLVGYSQPALKGATIRLSHNTLLADYSFALSLETNADLSAADPANPAITVEASENILDSKLAAFLIGNPQTLTVQRAQELLPALLRWKEQHNLYPAGVAATKFGAGNGLATESLPGLKTLDQWKQFWKLPSDAFQTGRVRYQGSAFVTPADLRLAAGSPGKGAGTGGKDLGANVDLVGPGAAYERWKITAEYQEWLKQTGRALSGVAALPPAAVAPFGPKQAREHQVRWAAQLGISAAETNSLGMKFQLIPPGEFEQGSTDKELERWREAGREQNLNQFFFNILASEGPQHHVVISKPLYMAATEVTRGEFRKFVEAKGYKTAAETDGKGGGFFEKGVLVNRPELNWKNPGIKQNEDTHPVTQVTWDDALAFCQWLSEKEGRICRLPTEAEWEYACRAGTTTSYHGGDTLRLQDFDDPRYIGGTNPVELFAPNPFGLFGMHTNVIEWCSDFWDQSTYSRLPGRVVDPTGPKEGTKRVQRDGAWGDLDCQRRSATRRGFEPSERHAGLGFRVVMETRSGGTP